MKCRRGRFDHAVQRGVDDAVQQQVDTGIDIVSDGETSKISYATYIRHRLSGFDGDSRAPRRRTSTTFRTIAIGWSRKGTPRHIVDRYAAGRSRSGTRRSWPTTSRDSKRAVASVDAVDGFITAVSPGTVGVFHPNRYYRSHEAYIEAVASAMRPEYEEIVRAGFLLQIDCPDLAMGRHSRFKDLDDAQFLRYAEMHVEALNEALAKFRRARPASRVLGQLRGSAHARHAARQDPAAAVRGEAAWRSVIEGANPRHEHEWEVWTRHRLPDDKILVPGVIDTSTNYVEHPELVAQRIDRYAKVVGPGPGDGRHRLRDGHLRWIRTRASRYRLGEAAVAGGGRRLASQQSVEAGGRRGLNQTPQTAQNAQNVLT